MDESAPMGQRTKCVWGLRQQGGLEGIHALSLALCCPSVLLAHEVAFALGQMADPQANPVLAQVFIHHKHFIYQLHRYLSFFESLRK